MGSAGGHVAAWSLTLYVAHFSDGTLTENSCSENPWSRDVKQGKVYHSKPEHRKGKDTAFLLVASVSYFTSSLMGDDINAIIFIIIFNQLVVD